MSYRVPLPTGSRMSHLDIVEPNSTAVQRFIRRNGLGAYEPPTAAALLAWCELAGSDFVLFDVGANMGLYGELAASVFAPRAVHSFEPAPTAAAVARKIAKKNRLRLTVHELALSDEVGSADLYLSPISDASNSLVKGFRDTSDVTPVVTSTIDAIAAEIGVAPDLVKIDVETHERAVLDGALDTIRTHRPTLIVEVLRRKGTDHGEELTEFFSGLDYCFYELSLSPTWEAADALRGSGTSDRDWLITPQPLADDFAEAWACWRDRLSECDVQRNPRVPVAASVEAAYKRGGIREVLGTAERYWRARRRKPPLTTPDDQAT